MILRYKIRNPKFEFPGPTTAAAAAPNSARNVSKISVSRPESIVAELRIDREKLHD